MARMIILGVKTRTILIWTETFLTAWIWMGSMMLKPRITYIETGNLKRWQWWHGLSAILSSCLQISTVALWSRHIPLMTQSLVMESLTHPMKIFSGTLPGCTRQTMVTWKMETSVLVIISKKASQTVLAGMMFEVSNPCMHSALLLVNNKY